MADTALLSRLVECGERWNEWRARRPGARVDLRGAELEGADLRGRDLIGVDLRRARLSRSTLCGCYLLGADLRGAVLEGADLRGADLRGADLCGADLRGSLFLIQSQLEAAVGDRATRLDPLLRRPAHWSRGKGRSDTGRDAVTR